MTLSTSPLVEDKAVTITCKGNTGKPKGSLHWYQTSGKDKEQEINEDTTFDAKQPNDTYVMTETYKIPKLLPTHNGMKFRCAANNPKLTASEERQSTSLTLSVLCK